MWSSHHVISMDYSNPEYQARGTCASLMPWHGHSGILHRRSTWTKRWWQILVRRHWISWSSTWRKATAWRWWVLHCGCPLVSKLHRNGMKWNEMDCTKAEQGHQSIRSLPPESVLSVLYQSDWVFCSKNLRCCDHWLPRWRPGESLGSADWNKGDLASQAQRGEQTSVPGHACATWHRRCNQWLYNWICNMYII